MNAINHTQPAAKPVTQGAGVNGETVIVPGKRLRSWHRALNGVNGAPRSLKAYVRELASLGNGAIPSIAKRWIASKGMRL